MRGLIFFAFLSVLGFSQVSQATLTVGGPGQDSLTYSSSAQIGSTSTSASYPLAATPSNSFSSTSALPAGTSAGSSTTPRAIGSVSGTLSADFAPGNPNVYNLTLNSQESVEGSTSSPSTVVSSTGAVGGLLGFSSDGPVQIAINFSFYTDTFGTQEISVTTSSSTLYSFDDNNFDGSQSGSVILTEPAGSYYLGFRDEAGDMSSNSGGSNTGDGTYLAATDRASTSESITITSVPEPSILGVVMAGAALLTRRRRSNVVR